MIETLNIKNYALIKDISVDFKKGFTVLSGETGAGKSILVGALGLLLGNKSDTETIRTGEQESTVSALFVIDKHIEALKWLDEKGIISDDGAVLIRRTIKRVGRGTIFIQSTQVTLADLSDFTDMIVDMHSQHSHQSLLRSDNHRKLVDHFANQDDFVRALSIKFYQLSDLKKERDELEDSISKRKDEVTSLELAIHEIEKADISLNESEELNSELKVISQSEKLFSSLSGFTKDISESRLGALGALRKATSKLESISDIDATHSPLLKRFESAFYEIEDISETLSNYQNSLDFSPEKLDEIQTRLQLIKGLTKKYGGSVESVFEYRENALNKLNVLADSDNTLEKLVSKMEDLENTIRKDAYFLSKIRKSDSLVLEKSITNNLRNLGMNSAIFNIDIQTRAMEDGKPACGPTGIDVIKFLFSANVGEPLRDLRTIASGGELSRVMLAIKSVFADKDPVQTLVFDEIDTGVGGEVAKSIAQHIAKLGEVKQILCISHLATIAAKASSHFKILKESVNNSTITTLISLESDNRIREIGRMLSGDSLTDVSLKHAKQLILEK